MIPRPPAIDEDGSLMERVPEVTTKQIVRVPQPGPIGPLMASIMQAQRFENAMVLDSLRNSDGYAKFDDIILASMSATAPEFQDLNGIRYPVTPVANAVRVTPKAPP